MAWLVWRLPHQFEIASGAAEKQVVSNEPCHTFVGGGSRQRVGGYRQARLLTLQPNVSMLANGLNLSNAQCPYKEMFHHSDLSGSKVS